MSGTQVRWSVDDRALRTALQRLEHTVRHTAPVLRAIGTALVEGTHQRFEQAVDPDGRSWVPLNPAYAAIKRGPGILRGSAMRGGLMASITMRAGADHVAVGTNRCYAAIHQFGGTITAKSGKGLFFRLAGGFVRPNSVRIPARPFIGISRADEAATMNVIEGAIRRATS